MKALWLARLARPDIIKPINDLATKVQSWTKAEDKKVLRLIQYIDATKHYRLVGYVNDDPSKLYLSLLQTPTSPVRRKELEAPQVDS